MTRIYVLCSDGIFRRMLESELSLAGGDICPANDGFITPCAVVADAKSASETALPSGDEVTVVIFGYEDELSAYPPSPTAIVLARPFRTDDLIHTLFGESGKVSPSLRKMTAAERLVLSPSERTATLGSKTVKLSKREFALLEYLYKNRGIALPREKIYSDVWGGGKGENVVDVYVCYLREKVEKPFGTRLISTARGTGYIFGA